MNGFDHALVPSEFVAFTLHVKTLFGFKPPTTKSLDDACDWNFPAFPLHDTVQNSTS